MKLTFKSIGAVFAGLVAIFVLSSATDFVLEATGVYPPLDEQLKYGFNTPWMISLAIIYRSIYSIAGCYLAASLAPSRPMRHAMILGGVGFAISILGTIIMWDKSPAWYPISLVILALPCAWFGGKLKSKMILKNSAV